MKKAELRAQQSIQRLTVDKKQMYGSMDSGDIGSELQMSQAFGTAKLSLQGVQVRKSKPNRFNNMAQTDFEEIKVSNEDLKQFLEPYNIDLNEQDEEKLSAQGTQSKGIFNNKLIQGTLKRDHTSALDLEENNQTQT